MRYPIRLVLSIAMAGGLAALPSWGATTNKRKTSTDEEGVQEAIRFERAKQAAADRQARIEAQRNRADRSAQSQPSAVRHPTKAKKHRTGSAARQQQH